MSIFKKITEWFRKRFGKNGSNIPDPRIDIDFGDEGTDGAGENAKENASGIVRFRYSYNGSIGGDSFTWEADRTGDAPVIKAEEMIYPEYGEMTDKTDNTFFGKLEEIYKTNRLERWNGFNKYNRHILDGSGFSLEIVFSDGKRMSAHGSNSFPAGYRDFRDSLDALFKPEIEKLHEREKQKIIDRGIEGELDSILATFIQKGTSGRDSYELLLMKQGIRNCNFDVKVRSVSGEFIAPGEYQIYRDVPDDVIDFSEFDRIVKKHGLIRWLNYNESAQDYNNSEWFQLSLGFDKTTINACGTKHPEGYDAFRHEFLTELSAAIRRVQEYSEEKSE